ncbi:helix-turn-helix domain-containing protein [Thiomicrorhabdus cannonii]|uniref:helix-turn-helix domain-containing protein n=1 Tax=Thiomicrorhabdus cannonii TaxID=2748011 RepID=UPI001C4DB21D|nr:helix-turn-helix domain-containing protein [Thiomicrorhabdus cannonii]
MTQQNTLIPPDETAKQLGVTIGTLATWRNTGRNNLPFVKIGRKVMYRQSDIESWIAKHTFNHTNQAVAQ